MSRKLPTEVSVSALAGTTAFVGGFALHLPPWAIFIGWAGAYFIGGPNLTAMKKLWATMPVGSTYALIIVLITGAFSPFGTSDLGEAGFTAVVIVVVNIALMYTGRLKLFALIPGMFFGFASFFATFYGGFGWDPGNPWVAWISVIAMNLLGLVYAWVAEWLHEVNSDPE